MSGITEPVVNIEFHSSDGKTSKGTFVYSNDQSKNPVYTIANNQPYGPCVNEWGYDKNGAGNDICGRYKSDNDVRIYVKDVASYDITEGYTLIQLGDIGWANRNICVALAGAIPNDKTIAQKGKWCFHDGQKKQECSSYFTTKSKTARFVVRKLPGTRACGEKSTKVPKFEYPPQKTDPTTKNVTVTFYDSKGNNYFYDWADNGTPAPVFHLRGKTDSLHKCIKQRGLGWQWPTNVEYMCNSHDKLGEDVLIKGGLANVASYNITPGYKLVQMGQNGWNACSVWTHKSQNPNKSIYGIGNHVITDFDKKASTWIRDESAKTRFTIVRDGKTRCGPNAPNYQAPTNLPKETEGPEESTPPEETTPPEESTPSEGGWGWTIFFIVLFFVLLIIGIGLYFYMSNSTPTEVTDTVQAIPPVKKAKVDKTTNKQKSI